MKLVVIPFLIAGSLMAQGVKWETNLEAAKARAKAEHKLIFMDVWTEWCSWCLKLQKDTFPSPAPQAVLARVVPLSVKTQLRDRTPTADNYIEAKYQLEGFPALFVLDAEGKVVAQQPGYLPPDQFAAWLSGAIAPAKRK